MINYLYVLKGAFFEACKPPMVLVFYFLPQCIKIICALLVIWIDFNSELLTTDISFIYSGASI